MWYFIFMKTPAIVLLPVLDELAKARIEVGEPVMHEYNGWPESRVVSTEPYEEQKYGIFRNRAPHVVGSVAVAGFTAINELWPGVIIDASAQEESARDGLYVVGFSPLEYFQIVDSVLTLRS
jgi:hypothetical protein